MPGFYCGGQTFQWTSSPCHLEVRTGAAENDRLLSVKMQESCQFLYTRSTTVASLCASPFMCSFSTGHYISVCLSVVFYLDLTNNILIHLKSPDNCDCTPENLWLRVKGKHFDRLKDAAVALLQSALSCCFWFALVYKIKTVNAFAHWMLTICASISCVENIQYSTYLFVILPFTWTA